MGDWNSTEGGGDVQTPPPAIGVARAVQRLTAQAVKRAVPPLGLLIVAGVIKWAAGDHSGPTWILLLGAPTSALVMLAYGVQAVRRVLGRPAGAWGPIFWVASWVPYLFGLYVVGRLGLRPIVSTGVEGVWMLAFTRLAFTVLGGLVIRAQWKLSDVHSLAQEMAGLVPGDSEAGTGGSGA